MPDPEAGADTIVDPRDAAESAGLIYVDDEGRGIRRRRAGRGFGYVKPDGQRVSEPATLERIRKLAIPPAWTDVWICPKANGHIQATGRDAQRRKQYRYHPQFREVRESTKYEHMMEFARALPAIRATLAEHMAWRGLPREKVLATVVHLLETTLIRVGNDDYAKDEQELRPDHAAQSARDGRGRRSCASSSRARAARRGGCRSRTAASRGSSRPARSCPARSCSSTSTTTASRRT